uniref:Intraflagellar transport protein 122 homolog n=1 Tax=Caenorhabditis tropicalis TaxID=1561998 RepID=A0A1I7V1E6_9PELO
MRLADLFAAFGYCQQAVDCYLKRNQPQKALDVCIEQSQWDLAHSIANGNHLKIVDVFMEKYVEDMQGVSDDKSVGLLGLYMRARKFLDAAKIAFEIANDRREKMKPVADLKKCYVLAAILVEMYRSSSKNAHQITTHPEDVLDDEFGLSMDQIRILETTWRGAEAFHFMMLAQKHFLIMIALAAANAGQFRICSRAMMKLEAYEGFSEAEREEMKNLSFQLFAKNPPYNPKEALGHCPSCDADMGKYESQCMTCGRKPYFEKLFKWLSGIFDDQ